MTLTLEMPRELESKLREEASRRGITAEDCVKVLLEERLLNGSLPIPVARTSEERKRAFRAWAESHRGLPTLPEEAFKRASFYGERG
jgi:hypothetical protein